MLITFKSKAAGDVIMFGDVAKQMLVAMGKSVDKQGIITVEQLPEAIKRLKQAAAETKAQQKPEAEDDEPKRADGHVAVSLAQRAVPLIELLEYSLKAKAPVTWGT